MSMHVGQLFATGLLAAGLAAEHAVPLAAEHAESAVLLAADHADYAVLSATDHTESAVPLAADHADNADLQKADQHKDQQQSGVAGKWTMRVDAGPHGATAMGLTLEQKGTKVSGTFASPHGDMPVDGEFVDAVLKLSTSGGDADSQITFEATLKDGKLSGYLSSQMGDMKWTAERVNSRAGL